MFKKLISIIMAISIVFSLASVVTAEESEKEYYLIEFAKINQQLLQAEEITLDEALVSVEDAENSFGGKHVRLASTKKGEAIAFNVKPQKTSQLVFWARYSAESRTSNTVYFYLDGKEHLCELPVTGKNKYAWFRIDAAMFPASVTHMVEFRVSAKESGMAFDSFFVTDDSAFVPTDFEEDFKFKYPILTHDMDGFPSSGLKPIDEHPRLMFTKEDIPRLIENLSAPESAKAYEEFKKALNTDITGYLPQTYSGSSNRSNSVINNIEAHAYNYALFGNEEDGKKAVSMVKNMLGSFLYKSNSQYYEKTYQVFLAAEVYDWCYDLLTKDDKDYIVYHCQKIIQDFVEASDNTGYPLKVREQGAVASTITSSNPHQSQLAFAIAIYDEYPDLFDFLSAAEVHYYKPSNDYLLEGGVHPNEGSSYGRNRVWGLMYSHYLLKKACNGYELYDEEKLADFCIAQIYQRLPNGFRFRSSDSPNNPMDATNYELNPGDVAEILFAVQLTDDEYKKQVLKASALDENNDLDTFTYYHVCTTPLTMLILNEKSVEPKSYDALPKTKYFPKPIGRMIARTGWNKGLDSNDVIAFMNIKTEQPVNHMHPDAGTFQIFYKGLVNPDLGSYHQTYPPNFAGHNHQTLSKNGLLIHDPSEKIIAEAVNYGGQRCLALGYQQFEIDRYMKQYDTLWKYGDVIGMEFGPDKINPEYSYISGDITPAYTDKVSEVRRSMMFMPTDNEETPAVFFVMDKINSAKAEFKKSYVLQAFEEPTVSDNYVVTSATAHGVSGAAVNQTLYPEVEIETIGGPGKAWYVNGVNLAPNQIDPNSIDLGWGRVEISPKTSQNLDYFMNVIYVCDKEESKEKIKADLIDNEDVMGARILNKVSVFAKDSSRPSKTISFEIPGNGETDVAVTGIAPGEWQIENNGNITDTQISTQEGGMIYFKADAGKVTIKHISGSQVKKFTEIQTVTDVTPNIQLKYNGALRYSKTALYNNGTCYIPIETLASLIGAEIDKGSDGKTVSFKKGSTMLSATEGSASVTMSVAGKDTSFEHTVPLFKMNDSLMLPARTVVNNMRGKITWGIAPQSLNIEIDEDILYITGNITIKDAKCGGNQAANVKNSYDGDRSTIWNASGDGSWIIWEFENVTSVNSFVFDANRTITDRKYLFELYYSTNGDSWTKLYDGASPGDGSKLYVNLESPVKAKYIKYVGHMSTYSGSSWSNLADILFSSDKLDLDQFIKGGN